MSSADYDQVHAAYQALLQRHPQAVEKGKKNRYTSVNGQMSSFLSPQAELCIRLSDDDREAFNAAYGGGPVMQYGSVMRGYVEVPGMVWTDPELLLEWFEKSWAYVSGLKPKATKR